VPLSLFTSPIASEKKSPIRLGSSLLESAGRCLWSASWSWEEE